MIPVFVYNNPKTTGVAISAGLLNRLADYGVRGVKDSGFDIMVFNELLRVVKREDFIPIIGTEARIFPAVSMGAHGSVSGLANAIPEPVVELFHYTQRGDIEKARRLQTEVSIMRDIMHLAPTLPMIQAVLRARGVNAGYPKLSFVLPEDSLVKRAVNEFKGMGVSF